MELIQLANSSSLAVWEIQARWSTAKPYSGSPSTGESFGCITATIPSTVHRESGRRINVILPVDRVTKSWFGIFTRNVIRGGIWQSKQELVSQIMHHIRPYKQDNAQPFSWTYTGKPLVA